MRLSAATKSDGTTRLRSRNAALWPLQQALAHAYC
jgi:hypothetical protein